MKFLKAFLLSLLVISTTAAEDLKVSVAVSLKEAMTDIAKAYKTPVGRGGGGGGVGGDDVTFTFGASGQLSAQIKDGADVDAFISAANTQVDDLIKAGLAEEATRRVVAGNTLVMVVPANLKETPMAIADLADSKYKKIAIGEPKTVPAGDYAMQTLTALKLNDKVADRLVYGTNVRQVLTYVESGDVAAGFVYATDAKESGDKVKVIATADEQTHKPIVYPGIVIKATKHHAATLKFLDYLKTPAAQKILTDKGFSINVSTPPTIAPAPKP